MAHEILHCDELSDPVGVFVQATRVPAGSDVIQVSGLTSRAADGSTFAPNDIKAQTRHILENLKKILAEADATLEDVAKVTVYITNMDDFDAIHEIRREYFTKTRPASTMVEVSKLVNDDMLIEIEAIAYTKAK
ncbi:MAG: RidA family protein [Rhodospirillaceae bacterium]|jgi:reactive intermediate/imine deaminase|nr:RidA family protein [Rhodospirillaceae bacterium]MBT3883212.1 RidA family protein [Rhodospirillaceae bacterium]MBT4116415.1 RidA family protein [Rhodospirillaceae bacterium]MBT4670531.1 RidA family protein [Rhodospirillaceae bacterium]MBT4722038.1 RidA family protein [Rhodospirillaceae bacterium]